MHKHRGFSLVEMLVAGAILGILLTVLTNLFIGSNKASTRVNEVSDQQQQAQAARQVLQYELGLAGYRGTLNDTTVSSPSSTRLLANRTFTGTNANTISITKRSSGSQADSLTIRYYEDRSYTSNDTPILRAVTFSIGSDSGHSALFRSQDSGAALAIIPDVTNLKIAGYLLNDDTKAVTASNNLAGIKLNVTYSNTQQDTILIAFQNSQKLSIVNQ